MNFNLTQIPERNPKPRAAGITMVMDKGLSVNEAKNFLSVAHPHIDIVNGEKGYTVRIEMQNPMDFKVESNLCNPEEYLVVIKSPISPIIQFV